MSTSTASLQQRVQELEQQLHTRNRPGTTSTPPFPSATGEGVKSSGGVSEAEQLALPLVNALKGELSEAQTQLTLWERLLEVRGLLCVAGTCIMNALQVVYQNGHTLTSYHLHTLSFTPHRLYRVSVALKLPCLQFRVQFLRHQSHVRCCACVRRRRWD